MVGLYIAYSGICYPLCVNRTYPYTIDFGSKKTCLLDAFFLLNADKSIK